MNAVKKSLVWITIIAITILLLIHVKSLFNNSEKETEIPFFSISSEEIYGIEWMYNGEINSFIKKEGEWYLKSDESFPVNQVILDSMESAVSDLVPLSVLPNANPSEHGINENSFKISITKTDGSVDELIFGSSDTAETYYMQVSGNENIYTMPGNIIKDFSYSQKDLLQKENIPSMLNVNAIIISKNNTTLRLDFNSETGEWESGGQALNAQKTNELKNRLTGIVWGECVNYNASDKDLKLLGLQFPSASVCIQTSDNSVSFEFGNESDGEIYTRLASSKMIYKINADIAQSLITDAAMLAP